MKEKVISVLILSVVLISSLYFGLPKIRNFSGVDEALWSYDRIPVFWNSITRHRWRATNINDKPGITLAIISGTGLPFVPNPKEFRGLIGQVKTPAQLEAINDIYFHLRFPVFLFGLAMLFLFFVLLRKLFDEKIALGSVIFIGLSPTILGISTVLNPDSLLWAFLPLSIISYLIFQKENSRKYLCLSGLFLGLSLLTKYVANILYIYFVVLIFLEYVLDTGKQAVSFYHYLKNSLLNYGIMVFVSLATFFVFFPATWISPKMVLEGTFLSKPFEPILTLFVGFVGLVLADTFFFKNKAAKTVVEFLNRHKFHLISATSYVFSALIVFVLVNTYSGMHFYDFGSFLSDPKWRETSVADWNILAGNIFADIYSLIFGLTPVVFLFFLFALFKNFKIKELSREKATVLQLTLFIIFYYAASTVNHISATVRYQIVLYPIASIIAAIGLGQFFSHYKMTRKYFSEYALYTVLILLSVGSLYLVRPYFSSYSSGLLPSRYIANYRDMGDGNYEVSEYLNSLPDAKDLTVWSASKQACEKFIGRCIPSLKPDNVKNINFDYFIISKSGEAETISNMGRDGDLFKIGADPIDLDKFYSPNENYDFKVILDNRADNFIKVASFKTISE